MNGRGLITVSMRELERVKIIEAVADGILGVNGLDDALAEMNDKALADVLESWFVSIRNRPKATSGVDPVSWTPM